MPAMYRNLYDIRVLGCDLNSEISIYYIYTGTVLQEPDI